MNTKSPLIFGSSGGRFKGSGHQGLSGEYTSSAMQGTVNILRNTLQVFTTRSRIGHFIT